MIAPVLSSGAEAFLLRWKKVETLRQQDRFFLGRREHPRDPLRLAEAMNRARPSASILQKFLQCELGTREIAREVLRQEKSPRALISLGLPDFTRLLGTSVDVELVETRRIELLTFALRTRRSPS
jgi:hypothetical protein